LSEKFQQPIDPPDWSVCFADLSQPLHLDIGSARGRFLLEMAERSPHWNFLGLEIREPLVEEANSRRDQQQLRNLHYLFYNANCAFHRLLQSLPVNRLQYVTVQFPDPWFKKRHRKRQVVQPELVLALAEVLEPNGEVLLQSDVERVAQDMCDCFALHPAFQRQQNTWLSENPLPVPTEREISTLSRNQPVYRALFVKRSLSHPSRTEYPCPLSLEKRSS
jgi:tRNA (guanine-N7-)-methyltransferase